MRRHRVFIVICVLALALGAGYFLQRGAPAGRASPASPPSTAAITQSATDVDSSTSVTQKQSTHRPVASTSSAPLPPPGTPLKDIYDELAARARSGDRAASVRLFHDTAKCRYATNLHQTVSDYLPDMIRPTSASEDAKYAQFTDTMLNELQEDIDKLKALDPLCAGLDQNKSRNSPDWMRLAAEQGDQDAIDCYLDLSFVNIDDGLQHLHWLSDFQQAAPEMAKRAIAAGDWKSVFLLESAYNGYSVGSWLSQAIAPNSEQAYRYTYLMQLGSTRKAFFVDRLHALESELTPETIEASRNWANEMFSQNFNGTPSTIQEIRTVCPNPTVWPD